jgi:multiple antibiotic resistance protein
VERFSEVFYSFVTLLAMVNPLSAAAAFATLTEGRTAHEQTRIAVRATIYAVLILIAFGYGGEALLKALGVSMQAFRIAGGLLLFRVGANMVFAQNTQTDTAEAAKQHVHPEGDPTVFPLAIPIITGPGALTVSIPLAADQLFVPMAAVVFAITLVFMLGAEKITEWFGRTGVDAASRIVGIIIAAIAAQLVITGVTELLRPILQR